MKLLNHYVKRSEKSFSFLIRLSMKQGGYLGGIREPNRFPAQFPVIHLVIDIPGANATQENTLCFGDRLGGHGFFAALFAHGVPVTGAGGGISRSTHSDDQKDSNGCQPALLDAAFALHTLSHSHLPRG